MDRFAQFRDRAGFLCIESYPAAPYSLVVCTSRSTVRVVCEPNIAWNHPKENDQEAVEDFGPKSSPSIGEKLKELLTAKPASYSEDEKPRRAEKEQMSAPQEEFIQEKP
jgi:hypothetical protein